MRLAGDTAEDMLVVLRLLGVLLALMAVVASYYMIRCAMLEGENENAGVPAPARVVVYMREARVKSRSSLDPEDGLQTDTA